MTRRQRTSAVLIPAALVITLAILAPVGNRRLSAQSKPAPAKTVPAATATEPALRLRGFEQHMALREKSPFKALSWQFLGPTNVSGRCTDVAVVSPRGRQYTIYVATASGGLWKTDNEATSFEPIFDRGPSTSIGDVAIAPSNPDIVWIGTGEANIYRSSQGGIGVYKSVDAGKSWTHMGLAGTGTIARLVIHPTDPNTVYAAASGYEWTTNAERGVYKSTDGGATWTKSLFVDEKTGAIDLVMDPADPSTLYAATWQRTRLKWNDPRTFPDYGGSGIYKTSDAGRTWKPINEGLPPANRRGRIGLDLCATRSQVIYALVDNYIVSREPTEEEKADPYGLPSSGFIKGATVYRSDDGGGHWSQVSGLTPEQQQFMERHSGTYGWVFGQIRVDPNDPQRVYTMGLGLNVSVDGGKTFSRLRTAGSDHHGLWIDPANPKYLVNAFDQGFAISYDGGRSWKDSDLTLPASQFFNVSYDINTPFHVYGSMQDHGSFRAPVDLSRGRAAVRPVAFEQAPGGEGSTHAVDPSNPNLVYASGFYGTLARWNLASKGEEGKELLPARYPDEGPWRGEWLAPTIISSHNPRILFHGMQSVLMSRDQGDTWETISPDLTYGIASEKGDIPYHTLTTIADSPLRFGLLYAGTDDGRLHVTRDAGKSWTEITAGLAPKRWMSRVVASAFDLGTVYVTQNGKRDDDFTPYVWMSTDFGKTWSSLASGIPVGPVNVIREDPGNRDILYLGTDLAVYVSTDRGKSWSVLGGNLPSTYVHDLIIHPRDNMIVAATHGRGMWVLDAEPVNRKSERRRGWDE